MGKKYKTKKDPETGLLRIIALKDFSDVKKGDKGGLISTERNLSQKGDCWVYEGAKVLEYARVYRNAKVYGNACVSDYASIYGKAIVSENVKVSGISEIYGNARVWGDVKIYEGAEISGNAEVSGNAKVSGVIENAWVSDNAKICRRTMVYGNAVISGNVKLWSTYSNYNNGNSNVTAALVKNSKDFIILKYNRKEFLLIFLSNINTKNIIFTTIEVDYIKNIQTIRQLYGEEI